MQTTQQAHDHALPRHSLSVEHVRFVIDEAIVERGFEWIAFRGDIKLLEATSNLLSA